MVLGRARFGVSRLGAKLMWDARQFASLEAKVLREQDNDGPGIYLASL